MKKLPICTQVGGWYHRLFGAEKGADEAFAYIKSLGFEGLDYGLDAYLHSAMVEKGDMGTLYTRPIEEILEFYRPVKEASEKHGIPIVMAHGTFQLHCDVNPDLDTFLWGVIEKQMAVCQYLNCPALVVHPITRADSEKEKEMNLAMYRYLIPAAKKYGVKICLENMFFFFGGHAVRRACSDAREACWYIDTLNEEAGEEIFGFCYDVGHANAVSNRIYDDLKLLGKRLTVLHIHENDGRLDEHLIPFTQANASHKRTVDWDGFLRGLREIGYEGPLNFETFAALLDQPRAMVKALQVLTYEVGKYFREELTK